MDDLQLEKEYLRSILILQNFHEDDMFGVYGLESMRVHAHEKLCDKYGVDYRAAKSLTLYLDEKIGLPVGIFDDEEIERLENVYAPKLAAAFEELARQA